MIYFDKQFLFINAIPLWLLYRILNYFLKPGKKKEFSLKKELFINCFFLYCLAVISVTFFPLFIGNNGVREPYISVNYLPVVNTLNNLKGIQSSNIPNFMLEFWIGNIGGNLILLLPMGVFLPILKERFKSLKAVAITGFLISLAIEVFQLLSVLIGNMGRVVDIDDLILNTIGAVVGYGIFCILSKAVKQFKQKKTQID